MPAAARLLEPTDHQGFITGPGATKTRINGRAAVRITDQHSCPFPPPPAAPHPPSKIMKGSTSVRIEGQGAARKDDTVGCTASIATGSPDVNIGD